MGQYFVIGGIFQKINGQEDFTLILVAPSPEALQRGVKAPERVWPDEDLLKQLQTAIKQSNLSDIPEEDMQDGCFRLIGKGTKRKNQCRLS